MGFVPYSNDKQQTIFITIDKFGRMCLSQALRKKLNIDGDNIKLVLLFDEESRKIGIKKDMEGIKPFVFDKERGYSTVKNFLIDNEIDYESSSVRYNFSGIHNSIYTFSASKDYNGELNATFKQEKNGNLERLS